MRTRKILGILMVAWLTPGAVLADGNNYGAAAYLQEGVGGRAAGLGGAFVGLADDATAGYWNPAGLTQMGLYMYEVGSQYGFSSPDVSASYLSYAFQWPEVGNGCVSWTNAGVGGIEGRDESGEKTRDFSSQENAVTLSYGRQVYDWVKGLAVGANLKFLHQSLGGFSAAGHGLDLAAYWQPLLQWDHTLGLNIQNLLQRVYWNGGAVDPSVINVKLGAALRFLPSGESLYYHHLIGVVDLDFSEYARFTPHLGLEYWPLRPLGIRAGLNGQSLTAGMSYMPEYYQIDYAFRYDPSDLAAHQHRLSILLRFK